MSNKAIGSLPSVIIGNGLISIGGATTAALIFGDIEKNNMLNIAGLVLCNMAAIVGVYKVILKRRYDTRLNDISDEDDKIHKERNLKKFDEFTDEEKNSNEATYLNKKKPIDKELDRIIAIDDYAKANIFLSLLLMGVGTALQVVGSTY